MMHFFHTASPESWAEVTALWSCLKEEEDTSLQVANPAVHYLVGTVSWLCTACVLKGSRKVHGRAFRCAFSRCKCNGSCVRTRRCCNFLSSNNRWVDAIHFPSLSFPALSWGCLSERARKGKTLQFWNIFKCKQPRRMGALTEAECFPAVFEWQAGVQAPLHRRGSSGFES